MVCSFSVVLATCGGNDKNSEKDVIGENSNINMEDKQYNEAIDMVVYMVSDEDMNTGEEVKRHKLVTEEALERDESIDTET